jgi:hypothetical protein
MAKGKARQLRREAAALSALDTTSPRRANPCGATERAPESSGSYFLETVLKHLYAVESLGVDPSLAENQVLGASKYSFPIILVKCLKFSPRAEEVSSSSLTEFDSHLGPAALSQKLRYSGETTWKSRSLRRPVSTFVAPF